MNLTKNRYSNYKWNFLANLYHIKSQWLVHVSDAGFGFAPIKKQCKLRKHLLSLIIILRNKTSLSMSSNILQLNPHFGIYWPRFEQSFSNLEKKWVQWVWSLRCRTHDKTPNILCYDHNKPVLLKYTLKVAFIRKKDMWMEVNKAFYFNNQNLHPINWGKGWKGT